MTESVTMSTFRLSSSPPRGHLPLAPSFPIGTVVLAGPAIGMAPAPAAVTLLKLADTLSLSALRASCHPTRTPSLGAIRMPEAAKLAPPAELATLPTRALRRGGENYLRFYYGPAVAEVARKRQKWLIRELTHRVG